jgi:non-ribosomal peptide synthetase component E (peptide arylation enzyme)
MAAFVILKEERNAAQLRQALRETLLPSELPKVFVRLTEFPLNAAGKIDTKALLAKAGRVAGQDGM